MIEIRDKVIELSKILNELDNFNNNIPVKDQEFDLKLSDLYHKLENMTLDSKKCYRYCKELKSLLLERREYKNNKELYMIYNRNIQKMLSGIDNRNIVLSNLSTLENNLRSSKYKNRIYSEEELNERIGV